MVALLIAACGSPSKTDLDAEPDSNGGDDDGDGSSDTPDGGGTTDPGTTDPGTTNPGTGADASTEPGPPPTGPLAIAQRVDQARYTADLTTIAQPRLPGSTHWQEIQDLCASRFTEYGFTVERQNYGTGVNVIGVRTGTSEPASEIVLGAHYDGVENCPAADDNGTGIAGVLEAARVLSMASYPKTLVLVCWDEEERGLIGSKAHAKRAKDKGEKIEAVFDLEMIGYKDDAENTQNMPTGFGFFFPEATTFNDNNKKRANFIGAGGDPGSEVPVNTLKDYADKISLPFMSLKLKAIDMQNPLLADLRRSDHAAYWDNGFPAMMITDTSNFRYDAYHCLNGKVDEIGRVNPEFATQVTRMVVGATAETLGLPRDF